MTEPKFDIFLALAHPERVQTRVGKKIVQLSHFPNTDRPLVAHIEGTHSIITYLEDGRYDTYGSCSLDLIILPLMVKIEKWIVWAKTSQYPYVNGALCNSLLEADELRKQLGDSYLKRTYVVEEVQR